MPAETGKRYVCATCGAEVIVTRGGDEVLYCDHGGGQGRAEAEDLDEREGSVAIQLGRRYVDEQSGIQVLCTKAGEGSLFIGEREMEVQQPRALPSSD